MTLPSPSFVLTLEPRKGHSARPAVAAAASLCALASPAWAQSDNSIYSKILELQTSLTNLPAM
jgi:hypothetical protein